MWELFKSIYLQPIQETLSLHEFFFFLLQQCSSKKPKREYLHVPQPHNTHVLCLISLTCPLICLSLLCNQCPAIRPPHHHILIEIALPVLNASQRHSKHVRYIISDIPIASEPYNAVFDVLADMPKDHTDDKQQWINSRCLGNG